MHTLMVVAAGLGALGVFLLVALGLGGTVGAGARWFIMPWLAASLVNLYVGTWHGHTVVAELPFLAIVFGVPALAAWGVMC